MDGKAQKTTIMASLREAWRHPAASPRAPKLTVTREWVVEHSGQGG